MNITNECVSSTVAYHTTRSDFYIIIKSSFHSVYFESRTFVLLYLPYVSMDFLFHVARSNARLILYFCAFTAAHSLQFVDIIMCIHVEIMIIIAAKKNIFVYK